MWLKNEINAEAITFCYIKHLRGIFLFINSKTYLGLCYFLSACRGSFRQFYFLAGMNQQEKTTWCYHRKVAGHFLTRVSSIAILIKSFKQFNFFNQLKLLNDLICCFNRLRLKNLFQYPWTSHYYTWQYTAMSIISAVLNHSFHFCWAPVSQFRVVKIVPYYYVPGPALAVCRLFGSWLALLISQSWSQLPSFFVQSWLT